MCRVKSCTPTDIVILKGPVSATCKRWNSHHQKLRIIRKKCVKVYIRYTTTYLSTSLKLDLVVWVVPLNMTICVSNTNEWMVLHIFWVVIQYLNSRVNEISYKSLVPDMTRGEPKQGLDFGFSPKDQIFIEKVKIVN